MIKKIAFTVYPVKDMATSRAFYEGQLDLKVTDNFENHWVEYGIGEGVLAISDMKEIGEPSMQQGGTLAFEVEDVDQLTAKLKAGGAFVAVEPFSTPVCRMSVVSDPDGNALIIHKVTA